MDPADPLTDTTAPRSAVAEDPRGNGGREAPHAGGLRGVGPRELAERRGYPLGLLLLAVAVSVAVLLPVVFLLWQAAHAGWRAIWPLMFRELTWTLLLNTIQLAVIVTSCAAVIACGAAWLIERTNLPLRLFWRAVVLLPLAIPEFVVGYTWLSLTPAVHGLFGASLVMTLGLYPLVYLPVAAALRRADSSLYEVARSLGCGRLRALFRTVLPQVRAALLG